MLELFPNNDAKADLLVRMSLTKLRSAGLSKQKAGYLKAIAEIAVDDGLVYNVLSKNNQKGQTRLKFLLAIQLYKAAKTVSIESDPFGGADGKRES